jgi:hypothetical protein
MTKAAELEDFEIEGSTREPNMIIPPPIAGGDRISLEPDPNIRSFDDVMNEIFAHFKMEKMGGASGRGWSSHATFQRCPYLFKLTYLEGQRSAPSSALTTGSAFHTFLALHYTWMLDDNLQLTPHIAREMLLSLGADAKAVIEAFRLYEAYSYKYERDYLTPIAMEAWASDEDGNTCRFDLIAEVTQAQPGVMPGIYIVEHKTAARFTADALEGWRNDGEILGQIMIWKRAKLDRKYGKLRGTIVNIVGKQKVIQFHRTIVPAQRWHVQQHMEDLKMSSALQQMYAAADRWPKFRANCVTKFGLCNFFDHCAENRKLVPIRKREWVPQVRPAIPAATESQERLANDTSNGVQADTLRGARDGAAADNDATTAESKGSNA